LFLSTVPFPIFVFCRFLAARGSVPEIPKHNPNRITIGVPGTV
jgi:hypothetical protein